MTTSAAGLSVERDGTIHMDGMWVLQQLRDLETHIAGVAWPDRGDLVFDASEITAMDTGGAVLLQRTMSALREKGRRVEVRGLRPEFEQLLEMVSLNWTKVKPAVALARTSWLERLGRLSMNRLQQSLRAQGKDTDANALQPQIEAAWSYADVTLTASRF